MDSELQKILSFLKIPRGRTLTIYKVLDGHYVITKEPDIFFSTHAFKKPDIWTILIDRN